ncbi:MAG: 16S rRNA (cytosine(1402)-N(4))-methyltransferase RsmH [Actinobacteria bacterium]|nr:16S rRNA (cytosine(1402)-N(4))-methyltransferase RsmH [Actinomycetota bacterium]
MIEPFEHVPVLAEEVLAWLGPAVSDASAVVDCTLGGGGHAQLFLDMNSSVRVFGIDKDPEAISAAKAKLASYEDRFIAVKGDLAEVDRLLGEHGIEEVAAFIYDLGVSSPQLDRADRGFRFSGPAPLDMRMDPSSDLKAADVVNRYSEKDLIDIIFRYGEERFARRVAGAIVARRTRQPFTATDDLAEVVKAAIPAATRRTGPHPARRTFQAIRIEVNHELESLGASLPAAIAMLKAGGRIAVISYHSLEDRIVKRTFAQSAKGCTCPRDLPVCVCGHEADIKVLTSKPVRPSQDEVAANPRSDSARMRVARKMGKAA